MSFHKETLKKPDGRDLFLYSTRPIDPKIVATNPHHAPISAKPEFRWHPLRSEWVAYASHRQDRTFLPPKDYSPLATTKSAEFPTEMPAGDYEVAVFENLFPSLNGPYDGPVGEIMPNVPTRRAGGRCEVLVFTQDPESSFGALSVERIRLILDVLADRTVALGKLGVRYVLPFENRGVEMGVTLHHPHSQLYGYPEVPPVPAKMLEAMSAFRAKNGKGLLETLIADERKDGRRMVVDDRGTAGEDAAVSFVPAFARYPYETWIAPTRPRAFIHELVDAERDSLARVLKRTIETHDALWDRPQPYLMALYQAPLDGIPHPEAHVHFELFPPYRTRDRLKYLAGTELGGGLFVNDSIPEEKAAELRAAGAKR